MLIQYTNKFKRTNIINIIKLYNIKNYSKLNKIELLYILNKNIAIIFLQRFIRNKLSDDNLCPISYNVLKYPFICIKSYNKFRYYSLEIFAEYLSKSYDDFKDPFTRESLPSYVIKYIEDLLKFYKYKKIIYNKNWKKKIEIRAEYLTITNCLNDILNQIFINTDLTINFIYNIILPQFIYYFHYLLLRHKSNCYTLINQYINCINYHPNHNKFYLIDYLKMIIIVNNL
jgi:hypothetical protein